MQDKKYKAPRFQFSALAIFAILFALACDTEKAIPDKSGWGFEYFPLEGNSFRIYDVTIVNYSILGEAETIQYQLKEVVADSFLNLANEYAYVLNRYRKGMDDTEWKLDSVWTATRNETMAVVVENNVPLVKMVFPVKENKQWDGNILNVGQEEKYKMGKVGKSLQMGSNNFNSTVEILQMDNPDTILVREKRWEIYAKDVGLIYKEKIQLKYCSQIACIGEGIIDSGIKYRQELIEYGKE